MEWQAFRAGPGRDVQGTVSLVNAESLCVKDKAHEREAAAKGGSEIFLSCYS